VAAAFIKKHKKRINNNLKNIFKESGIAVKEKCGTYLRLKKSRNA